MSVVIHDAVAFLTVPAEIIEGYMPPYPRPDTRPGVMVKCGKFWLRYSKGPQTGTFWDTAYGDNFRTVDLARAELAKAPALAVGDLRAAERDLAAARVEYDEATQELATELADERTLHQQAIRDLAAAEADRDRLIEAIEEIAKDECRFLAMGDYNDCSQAGGGRGASDKWCHSCIARAALGGDQEGEGMSDFRECDDCGSSRVVAACWPCGSVVEDHIVVSAETVAEIVAELDVICRYGLEGSFAHVVKAGPDAGTISAAFCNIAALLGVKEKG